MRERGCQWAGNHCLNRLLELSLQQVVRCGGETTRGTSKKHNGGTSVKELSRRSARRLGPGGKDGGGIKLICG